MMPLPALDADSQMAPPRDRPGTPTTPTQTKKTAAREKDTGAPASEEPTPDHHTTSLNRPPTSSISARLEEEETEKLTTGRNLARNPIDKYSPGPMPQIQDNSPTAVFEDIDINLVKEWELKPGGKLLAVPFDNDVMIQEAHDTIRSKILTAIAEILNAQEASVAAPRPSKEATKKGRTPTSFLIYNITDDQVTILLERGVWSSKTTTFRVTPFATICPSFFFAIKGFGTIATREIYPIVQGVWESEDTLNHIDILLNEVPLNIRSSVGQDLERIICTMYIDRLDIKDPGNTLAPRFNIYADCTNFTYDKIWTKLRHYLQNRPYTSPLEDQSKTVQIPFRCTCCHGVDHPRGLCPFPDLENWNGPKREGRENQRRQGNRGPQNRQRFAPY